MHSKAISQEVRKQLNNEYPNWHHLTRKEKKSITKKVIDEVSSNYDFKAPIKATPFELLGIETRTVQPGIITLDEMDSLAERHKSGRLFKLRSVKSHQAVRDHELKLIDELIDDEVINKLLYSPDRREFYLLCFFEQSF